MNFPSKSPTKFDVRGAYECPFCGALRNTEHNYRISDDVSVTDIQYTCGTILKVEFPRGVHTWYSNCPGSTHTNGRQDW